MGHLARRQVLGGIGAALLLPGRVLAADSATPEGAIPDDELKAIEILHNSRAAFEAAPRRSEQGKVWQKVFDALKKAGIGPDVTGWIGRFLESQHDERQANVTVQIGQNIFGVTANLTSLTDTEETLLMAGSRLYAKAESLARGDVVRFSATLISGLLQSPDPGQLQALLFMRFTALEKVQ